MSPPYREPTTIDWARRFRWASVALFVSLCVSLATPIVEDPALRAALLRQWRHLATRWKPSPQSAVALRVPFLRQEHALSCEAATLRMVLAYRGIEVTEENLMERIGYDPTRLTGNPRKEDSRGSGGAIWGDPDEAFVGDLDGIMGKTGYGVHAGPIGRAAGAYRRVEVVAEATPATIAAAVAGGNPVIIWGHLGKGRALTWSTLSGKRVRAVDGEHTRVVVGYTGTRDAPEGFHVLDPIYGEQYWKLEAFMENWERLGRTGVIMY